MKKLALIVTLLLTFSLHSNVVVAQDAKPGPKCLPVANLSTFMSEHSMRIVFHAEADIGVVFLVINKETQDWGVFVAPKAKPSIACIFAAGEGYDIDALAPFHWISDTDDSEHTGHPPQDQAIHELFYSKWNRPDYPTASCCNDKDCYPTQIRKRADGRWEAERREDGYWVIIPDEKLEQNVTSRDPYDSPDGRSHVCMQPPGQSDWVWCAVLGNGM